MTLPPNIKLYHPANGNTDNEHDKKNFKSIRGQQQSFVPQRDYSCGPEVGLLPSPGGKYKTFGFGNQALEQILTNKKA